MRTTLMTFAMAFVSVGAGTAFVVAMTQPTNHCSISAGISESGPQIAAVDTSVGTGSAGAAASMIRDLGNPDWTVQIAAARALAERQDLAIFNVLVKGLESKDACRRLGSALALAHRKEPQALQALFEQCPKRDIGFRFQVAEVLGQAKNVAFKDTLMAALRDQHWQVREFAVVTLANMHEVIGIEPLLLALKNEDSYVRQLACWHLGCIKDPRAIEPLLTDILKKYQTYEDRIWGGTALFMITKGRAYFAADAEKWEQWWKENKNSYLVKP